MTKNMFWEFTLMLTFDHQIRIRVQSEYTDYRWISVPILKRFLQELHSQEWENERSTWKHIRMQQKRIEKPKKRESLQTSIQSSWLYSKLPSKSAVSWDGSTILVKPSKETITVWCRRVDEGQRSQKWQGRDGWGERGVNAWEEKKWRKVENGQREVRGRRTF